MKRSLTCLDRTKHEFLEHCLKPRIYTVYLLVLWMDELCILISTNERSSGLEPIDMLLSRSNLTQHCRYRTNSTKGSHELKLMVYGNSNPASLIQAAGPFYKLPETIYIIQIQRSQGQGSRPNIQGPHNDIKTLGIFVCE